MIQTLNFETIQQKNKSFALIEHLERLSFPFLLGLKQTSEEDNCLCIENQKIPGKTFEHFIEMQKEMNQAIDENGMWIFELIYNQELQKKAMNFLLSNDLINFGTVLYSLAELKEFHQVQKIIKDSQTSSPNIEFNRLSNGPLKQIILSLLSKNPSQKLNAMQFLEKVEIQDRINQWTENQTFPLNSTKTAKQQFSEYRTYLAQLLVEVAGASAEERLIVAQHGAFNELVNILRWAREQDKDISRPLQEWICESVENIIDNNISSAEIAFQTEILIELQNLLENILPLEEVKFVHADALKLFTTYGRTDEQQKIMYDMGLTQTFLKTMKSKNSGVVEKSSAAIINMMIYDDNIMDKKELHKNFSECEQKGIISSLFQDGIINGKSDNAKQTSAYGLGWLFKTKELPNNMKSDVIKQLKSAMKNQTRVIQMNSSNALSILAWNQLNHAEILKDNFIANVAQILLSDNDQIIINLLKILRWLIQYGTNETQMEVKSKIPIKRIQEFTYHKDSFVKKNAFLLLSWVSCRDQMIKFKEYMKQIKQLHENESENQEENEMMRDVNLVLQDGINSIYEKGGVILRALKLAMKILNDNKKIVQSQMEEGKFVDLLFRFYESLSHEQVVSGFCLIVVCLIDVTTESQKLTMKQEKYFQPLIHLLKCEDDEDVLVYITLFMALFIVNMKHSGQIGQKDEFLSVMEKIGGLQQLVKIFVNDDADQNQEIKKYVSIVIGQLHKAQKVPDQFRSALIDSLKQMAFDKDDEFVYLSGLVLARLSECNENIADIVAGDLDFIEQYISRTAYSTIEQGMLLALNLLNFGSEDVKNKVKAAVPRNIVRQLIRSQEEDELFQQDGLVLTAVLLNDILQFIS